MAKKKECTLQESTRNYDTSNGIFGVVTVAELIGIVLFTLIVLWAVYAYTVANFEILNSIGSMTPWEQRVQMLRMSAYYFGVMALLCMTWSQLSTSHPRPRPEILCRHAHLLRRLPENELCQLLRLPARLELARLDMSLENNSSTWIPSCGDSVIKVCESLSCHKKLHLLVFTIFLSSSIAVTKCLGFGKIFELVFVEKDSSFSVCHLFSHKLSIPIVCK